MSYSTSFFLKPFKQLALACAITTPLMLGGCSTLSGLFGDDEAVERGTPKQSEKSYFEQAQKDIASERYESAVRALEDIRTFYPVGYYSKQALLDLIYVRVLKGDYQEASLSANRFIESYPTHPQTDYAWYAKGVADMQSGYTGIMRYTNLNQAHRDTSFLRAAYIDFKNLVIRYPNSQYAADAIQRMYFIYNQFAEHEMHIARFNVKRKAYLGAVERAKTVFLGFPQSPQTPEAIATLAYSYDKLGMTVQADTYKKLLRTNYPELLDGNQVRLAAARTNPSWLNRVSLGLVGESSVAKRLQNAEAVNGITAPKNVKEFKPAELPSLLQNNPITEGSQNSSYKPEQPLPRQPSPGLSIGLGLPTN